MTHRVTHRASPFGHEHGNMPPSFLAPASPRSAGAVDLASRRADLTGSPGRKQVAAAFSLAQAPPRMRLHMSLRALVRAGGIAGDALALRRPPIYGFQYDEARRAPCATLIARYDPLSSSSRSQRGPRPITPRKSRDRQCLEVAPSRCTILSIHTSTIAYHQLHTRCPDVQYRPAILDQSNDMRLCMPR